VKFGFFQKFPTPDIYEVTIGAFMARKSGLGAGWDPVTKVFVILAFIGSLIYIAAMLNDSVNDMINDSIGIDIQGP
jgi:hypothetical protein